MNKKLLIASLLIGCSVLICGCSGGKKDSELDQLINSLQTVYGSGQSPSGTVADQDNYISVSGKILSISKNKFNLKASDKEITLYIDDNTKIFGGQVSKDAEATVTYKKDQKDEKKIYAAAITILKAGITEAAATSQAAETATFGTNEPATAPATTAAVTVPAVSSTAAPIETKPAVTTGKPAVTTNKPAVTTNKPAVTTNAKP